MTVIPQNVPLTIVQGSTFVEELYCVQDDTGEVVNLSGYTARMQIRPSKESDDVLVDFTMDNNRIVIDAALGLITIRLSPTTTGALTFRTAVYDLEIEAANNGPVYRPIEGTVTLNSQVTR